MPARRDDRSAARRAGGPGRAGAPDLHGAAPALQGEAGDRPRAVRRAVADGLSEAQAGRAAADRGRRRPHPRRDREGRPAAMDARAAGCRPARRARSRGRWGSGCVTPRGRSWPSTTRRTSRIRTSSRRRPGASSAWTRLGRLPASEARLLQPAPEPADALVHARVRRLVQHLPPRAAPHRRTDPAGRHVEPLPPRGARASASAGIRTTSPRTRTSGCASPGWG